jgi:hypothetical protein
MTSNELLNKFGNLKIARKNGVKPQNPLLLLYALGKWLQKEVVLSYKECKEPYVRLLNYCEVDSKPDSLKDPFCLLYHIDKVGSETIWRITWDGPSKKWTDGEKYRPSSSELERYNASGGLSDEVQKCLNSNPRLVDELANRLLGRNYFPEETYSEPKLSQIRAFVGLQIEEANQPQSTTSVNQSTQNVQPRSLTERQIAERPGQGPFRDILLSRYRNRCLVTGCEVVDVLEAAHICTVPGEDDNDPENGLLLRADIHILFDSDLLGIDPDSLLVSLHPDVNQHYRRLAGTALRCQDAVRPSRNKLKSRYEQFRRRIIGQI